MSNLIVIIILLVVVIYLYNANKSIPEKEIKKEIIQSMKNQFEQLKNSL